MQENALHGWRLADGQHMRMTGYPGKTQSLGFTRNGKWLATSRRRRDGAVAVLRRRPDGQGADRTGRRRRRHLHHGRRPSRSTRSSRPASPTAWWCWPTSARRASCRSAAPAAAPVSALAWSADGGASGVRHRDRLRRDGRLLEAGLTRLTLAFFPLPLREGAGGGGAARGHQYPVWYYTLRRSAPRAIRCSRSACR